jgi:hypothetical protein
MYVNPLKLLKIEINPYWALTGPFLLPKIHQTVSAFLSDYGGMVDANQFALSEIVQWIWRSQIRDGKPIKLCILSKRMRKLVQDWLTTED